MNKIFLILFFIACLGNTALASEDDSGWFSNWLTAMQQTVKSPTTYDVYLPFYVRHMRWNYSKEQIDRYNESPGGFGLGISRLDGYNEDTLYVMGFTDSNYHFQGVFGYGWLTKAFAPENFFNVSGGITISAQMRHEYNYIPIPLPLPLASVDFGPLSLQGSYVPGWPGMGNVAIFWVKLKI